MVKSSRLSPTIRAELRELVRQAELRAHAEFVPVIIPAASRYRAWRWAYALVAFGLEAYAQWLGVMGAEGSVSDWNGWGWLGAQGLPWLIPWLSGLAVYAALGWQRLLVWAVPKPFEQRAVERRARELFLELDLVRASDRHGVLILVSEAERLVYVLADRGVAGRLDPSQWARLGSGLAQDLARGGAAEAFRGALSELGPLLAAHPTSSLGRSDANRSTARLPDDVIELGQLDVGPALSKE